FSIVEPERPPHLGKLQPLPEQGLELEAAGGVALAIVITTGERDHPRDIPHRNTQLEVILLKSHPEIPIASTRGHFGGLGDADLTVVDGKTSLGLKLVDQFANGHRGVEQELVVAE